MADTEYVALIHAEIDGELDGRQRGELARHLLADPEARALREELMQLHSALDSIEEVEPPAQLLGNILHALPLPTPSPKQLLWPARPWRYAALAAGVLLAAAVVYQSVDGPVPGTAEVVGTLAATRARVTLDTLHLDTGPIAGRVTLYRGGEGLGLALELVANEPVEVLIGSNGQTFRLSDPARGQPARQFPLSGSAEGGQQVNLTFFMSGREVGHATLRVPQGR